MISGVITTTKKKCHVASCGDSALSSSSVSAPAKNMLMDYATRVTQLHAANQSENGTRGTRDSKPMLIELGLMQQKRNDAP